MKRLLKINFLFVFVLLWSACEDELVTKAVLDANIASNTLEDLPSTSYAFTFDDGENNFDSLEWKATDFGFAASVTYTVQMDLAGADFANAFNLVSTSALKTAVKIRQINAGLLSLGAAPDEPVDVEIRIKSFVSDNVDPVYSTVISLTLTPYATSFPPIYLIGNDQGWDLGKAVELVSTGPGIYEGVGTFSNGSTFRFFETPAWDAAQWNAAFFTGAIHADLENANDGDSNFKFIGTNDAYKITVNTKTKSVELSAAPTLYIIGSDQGWNLANAYKLTALGGGRFKGTTTFANGGIWRFFEVPDWAATQYNYLYFEGGDFPSDLTNGGGNDSNFLFGGTSATYEIYISINEKIITMKLGEIIIEEPKDVTTMFLVGSDQSWNMDNALQMETKGNGVYEVVANFANAGSWRFFTEADWGATQYKFTSFTGGAVPADLANGGGGDANFVFGGITGIYKVTIDIENLTIAMVTATAPTLYVAGDPNGWSFSAFTWVTGGKFTGSIILADGNTFRFFGTNDWVQPQYGYSYFADGSISAVLTDKGDGDSNFLLAGAAGTYTVDIDLFGKVITLSQ